MSTAYNQSVQTIDFPPIPFVHELGAGQFPLHSELLVSGASYAGAKKSFAVELLSGRGESVALHVNPRFKFLEHTVVVNTRDAYCAWQTEARHSNPLHLGDRFHIRILNCADYYDITVNEKHLCKFSHRISPSAVTAVRVEGDVRIDKLQIITSANDPSPVYNHPPTNYGGAYGWQPPPTVPYAPPYNPPYMPYESPSPYANAQPYAPVASPAYGAPRYDAPSVPNISGSGAYNSSPLSQNPRPNVPQGPAPMYQIGDNFRPY